ncbi:MAG TPA: NAD-dependent epimerase/dehydratase family protein [Verrucomicrobiae bacterium]|nr:NAD-dependent epimerase/dehydratase family protein [Verrucomicrobiae bacterium]
MKRVCAITGTNGYVGGCIKSYFASHGWDIFELTRRPKADVRGMRFQLGDEVSPQLLAGMRAFVHCAYDFQALRWGEIQAVNIEGSRKVLAAARAAGIPKIVFISTISAFPGCRSLYGKAKLEIEKIALANGALVIRPGLVYGAGAGGMFGKLAEKIRKSSLIPTMGFGRQIQYLVHHEDLCGFIERYASGGAEVSPQVLTAANERPWQFRELLSELARGLGKKVTFIPLQWRSVWLALKLAELAGVRLNFRSDSVVSLMYQNPNPDFSANAGAGLVCRPFEVEKLGR